MKTIKRNIAYRIPLVCLCTALILTACNKKDDKAAAPDISYGTYVQVGKGKARSFVIKNADGSPKQVGFTFGEDALEGLPTQNTAFVLPMPNGHQSLVNHISFDFSVRGHQPDSVYTVPHFDVHFYMITEQEKNAITLTDPKIDILPAPEYIPKHYVPGANEPKMGKHWADTTASEFHGHHFESTLIYGSYNGKFIFIEPMIALNYLKTKPNKTQPITQQAKVQQPGKYPQTYSILWEKDRRQYTVSLNELTARQ
ncbi:DUF5602 domain-containing protein [Mucilaginibacter gynuensis]|uniref:DUF5602 domain-containing protein n=1 Tax=Mucilaginibacter gynuensis TaxID=1302236 RepID=A0ABP8GGL8_9SPHI